jgi:hypothetical protein
VAPDEGPPRRPRGPRIVLYLVVVAALAFLLQRLFRVDAAMEERSSRLASLDARWSKRVAEGGGAGGPPVPRIVERWNGLRREGGQPWRIRFLAPRRPVDRPPAVPDDLRARFDEETSSIRLSWSPAEDADEIVVHRSRGEGRSAATVPLDGAETSWSDPVPGLGGELVYWLQARRRELESPDSRRVRVRYAIPHRLSLRRVDLARKTATIAVEPLKGPHPAAEFRVQVDWIVGTRWGTFDYTTAFRLLDLGEIEVEEMVRQEVETFAPDGRRLRDKSGKPLKKWRMMPVPRRRPYAKVREGDGEPVQLFRDGR